MKNNLIEIADIEQKEIIPGFKARFVHTDNCTIAFWKVKKGAQLPEHSHIHEQTSQVLKGSFELTVAGKTRSCRPGQIAVIPSNIPHSGIAITDCEIMDIFYPVREDYR